MSGSLPTYALVTPARDEERNLTKLAGSILAQTVRPARWVIVDDASTDATGTAAADLAAHHAWIRAASVPEEGAPERGRRDARAFIAGVEQLEIECDVIVKVDADVTFDDDHFERLLGEFASDPSLGIASGTCWEELDGEWRPQHVTRSHVRGAVRAYRRGCLEDVSPLEERIGWDAIDEIKASVLGWRTTNFDHIRFCHHRPVGGREHSRFAMWAAQGEASHYMGYRVSYLAIRALFRAVKDPAALGLIWGFSSAAVRQSPRCADAAVRARLRREQRLRALPFRAREALGRGSQ